MNISRRTLFRGAVGLSGAAMLTGCSGFTGGGGGSDSGGGDTLSMVSWGQDSEQSAFKKLVQKYQESSGVTVDLRFVPFAEMFTTIDAQLQDGSAPDIFRVDYTSLASYSSADQLLDLSDQMDDDLKNDLIPAFMEAVSLDGRPYGVPHQTDTTATVYRPDLLRQAGITSVPDSLENAWTWEEFNEVLTKLKGSLSVDVAPYSYQWQKAGAYRWLNWLFQANGRLLSDDLKSAAIDSDAGRRALTTTKALFENKVVPSNSSPKSGVYSSDAFVGGKTAMAALGNFTIPELNTAVGSRFEWQATYHPQDVRAASDLGGNALVINKATDKADQAGEFLRFMMEAENQKAFCEETIELPTRRSVAEGKLNLSVRPDLAPVFTAQATTLKPEDVAQVTIPGFSQINTELQEQLEQCFVGGRSVDDALKGIADRVNQIVSA
ncbi:sugar ABC transporter substrate-binding protein [Kocuria sp. cx-455]|uniref:ABC transporter substrate-binding protein n=1 Tax=Kocuria sp. cx-455 TaxID=2771377 RepID=UPI0016857EC7|nr:sugar ABC transporter substrate-binding protein [Kocuria sp. cx-455]MBD2763794.1 sugar ABC transporter substrate-binding protein [Kocuria sp. cx-455]